MATQENMFCSHLHLVRLQRTAQDYSVLRKSAIRLFQQVLDTVEWEVKFTVAIFDTFIAPLATEAISCLKRLLW